MPLKIRSFIILLLCITGFLPGLHAEPESLFLQGNKAYKAGNFSAAAQTYREVLKEGKYSFNLYYNLGNSYYKLADYPSALLYYEKAARVKPGNEDLDINLRLARLHTTDKIASLPEPFLSSLMNNIGSSSVWASWTIIMLFLMLAFGATYLFAGQLSLRKFSFGSAFVCLLIAMIFSGFGFAARSSERDRYAIIFAEVSYIKNAPSAGSADAFYLHAGTKVQLQDVSSGYSLIRLPDGKKGWIPSGDMREI